MYMYVHAHVHGITFYIQVPILFQPHDAGSFSQIWELTVGGQWSYLYIMLHVYECSQCTCTCTVYDDENWYSVLNAQVIIMIMYSVHSLPCSACINSCQLNACFVP